MLVSLGKPDGANITQSIESAVVLHSQLGQLLTRLVLANDKPESCHRGGTS